MFRERMKATYNDLSPSFQRLADYLMDYPYEAAFMTATQLGRQLDVDTATVVRFAQRLNYPGYPELLDEIQAEVKVQLSRYFQPMMTGGNSLDVFRAVIRQDVANIEQFDLILETKTIERVVAMIDSARRILVVGEGTLSKPLAEMLSNALRALRYASTSLPTDAGTVTTEFRTLSSQDLVIAVAVTPYCPDATSIMQVAREHGAQTIGLVGAQSWPIARAVEVVMLCPSAGPSEMSSCSVFAVAINALFQALFTHRQADALEQLTEFEKVMQRLTEARSRFEFVPPVSATSNESHPS